MNHSIIIREEKEADYNQVYKLIETAFRIMEHSDHDEQNLVNRLRGSKAFRPELSLVAEYENRIIGHILFTEAKVGNHILLALAPVAVIPEMQNNGIGGRLITEGHKKAGELGYKGCIVLGHAQYYPKFGYKKASMYGIQAPFEVPDECFMAIELVENGLENVRGTIEYAKEFFEIN